MARYAPRAPPDLFHRVAAELRPHRTGDLQGDDVLRHHAGRGDGADVASLVLAVLRLPADEVHARKAAEQGGDRLHRAPDHHRHAVGHATLEPAGVVRVPDEAEVPLVGAGGVEADRVVDVGPVASAALDPETDLDRLERLDAHHRKGEPCVEPIAPLHARPESRRAAEHVDLDESADASLSILA